MRNLLTSLGIIKIDQAEYFEMLGKLHDDIPAMLLKEKDLDEETYNKAICEIKFSFWIIASTMLNNLPEYLSKETMEYFRNEIVFTTIDEAQFEGEGIQKFIESRIAFHSDGMPVGKNSAEPGYFRELHVLWFERPFSSIEEIRESNNLNFEAFGIFMEEVRLAKIYNNIVPEYKKSLKKLMRMTKK